MKLRFFHRDELAADAARHVRALETEGAGLRAEVAPLLAEVAPLLAEVAGLHAALATVEAENAGLRGANAALAAEVPTLTARVGQTSSNSSRPPSADPLPPTRPPRGRKPGGQPGQEAPQRALVPVEDVDAVVAHDPAVGAHCQTARPAVPDPDPVRHQVHEVPPVQVQIVEHHLHRVPCPQRGETTRAVLPPEVPAGGFGPRFQATVALLVGRYRLSRREGAEVCADLIGAPLSVGSVDGLCQATAAALAEPVAALRAAIKAAPVVPADETGWPQAGKRRTRWVGVGAGDNLRHCPVARRHSHQGVGGDGRCGPGRE